MNRVEIIERIERAIVSGNIKAIIPVMTLSSLTVDASSKQGFYTLLKEFIDIEKESSSGRWYSERKDFDANNILLYFYDAIHVHPRLSIQVTKIGVLTKLEVLPF